MQSKKNLIISAVAGSGKTTRIIEDCCVNTDKKIIFTTYINNNSEAIRKKLTDKFGIVPPNITVQSWYSFLIEDWVRPYANTAMNFEIKHINGMIPTNGISAKYTEKGTKPHYFNDDCEIFSDKVAEFGSTCNNNTGGKIIRRLEGIYDRIYIDEIQDMNGYDLDILDILMKSKIEMVVVGDTIQNIYDTSPSPWRKKDSEDVLSYLKNKYAYNSDYESMSYTYRCSVGICTFINKLFPDVEFKPLNKESERFEPQIIRDEETLTKYVNELQPLILGHNVNSDPGIGRYMNFKKSKGLEAEDVVIVATKDYFDYLTKQKGIKKMKSKRILYVAATRARHTIAFYYKK